MSHFTVLVVGENVEQQLIPFQEHACTGACPPEYMKFHDTEDEYLQGYQTDTVKEFYCQSNSSRGMVFKTRSVFNKLYNAKVGDSVTIYVSEFDVDGLLPMFCKNGYYDCCVLDNGKYSNEHVWIRVLDVLATDNLDKNVCTVGTLEVLIVNPPKDVKCSERYATFEEYVEDYHGYAKRDPKTNRYGYWENENAKWDWWQVGGRWSNFLRLKTGEESNSAKKSQVDWDSMMQDAAVEAEARYNAFVTAFGHLPTYESWESVRTRFSDVNEAREFYHAQPAVAEFYKKLKESGGMFFHDNVDDYLVTKDEYINKAKYSAISTFAVLYDGKWMEKGNMGWWGCVSDENKDWCQAFYEILKTIPDDMTVTVVDCHI